MKLHYSAQAEADIDEIEAWIIGEGSPLSAFRYIDRLDAAIAELVHFPLRFSVLAEDKAQRVFVFEHRIRVVYRIESDLLTIVRVFGAGRLIDL